MLNSRPNSTDLVLDIETVANEELVDLLPEVEAPSNYKKPESIKRYKEQKRKEQIEKMPLDIDFAKLRAVGLAWGLDSDPVAYIVNNEKDECEILKLLWKLINSGKKIIGYNIAGFDLPIILRRSWVLGIRPEIVHDFSRNSPKVVDLMQLLYHKGYAPGPRFRSLDDVLKIYGIPNPLPDVDGSQVADMTDEEVQRYVIADVEKTQELAKMTRRVYWV